MSLDFALRLVGFLFAVGCAPLLLYGGLWLMDLEAQKPQPDWDLREVALRQRWCGRER